MANRSLAAIEVYSELSSDLSSAPEENLPDNTLRSTITKEKVRKRAVDEAAIATSSKRARRNPVLVEADSESSSDLSSAPEDILNSKATSEVTKSKAKKREVDYTTIAIPRANPSKRARKGREPVYKEEPDAERIKKSATVAPGKHFGGAIVKKEEEVVLDTHEEDVTITITKTTRIVTETTIKFEEVEETTGTPKSKQKRKIKREKPGEADKPEGEDTTPKVKKKRKTKEEKEAEAMPLASRTSGTRLLLGAHVSAAGGVQNSVTNCVHIGGNAFALFLKSQRKWENPPLKPEHATLFHSACTAHAYAPANTILPHGSYLVNLAQAEPTKAAQAYTSFLDDLQRCETLGIQLYNFHPGNTNGGSRPDAIVRLAAQLNKAHRATRSVVTLLENMAASPTSNVIGASFQDLHDIIALVDDKSRVAVCLDTCHAFAAGYDLRQPSAFRTTLAHFDAVVGSQYLRAVHLNDSKTPLGSHRDLHQNIGLGFLGLRAFHNVVNEPRFWGIPVVLETPVEVKDPETGKTKEDDGIYAREIKLLEGLVGMDAEGEEFKRLEEELAERGREEREKYMEAHQRKVEKERKAKEKEKGTGRGKAKAKAKGKKGKEESSDDEGDGGSESGGR